MPLARRPAISWKARYLTLLSRIEPFLFVRFAGGNDVTVVAGVGLPSGAELEWRNDVGWIPLAASDGPQSYYHWGVLDEWGGVENPVQYRAMVTNPLGSQVTVEKSYVMADDENP